MDQDILRIEVKNPQTQENTKLRHPRSHSLVLRSEPLCETLPSLRIEKRKRAFIREGPEEYYKLQGLSFRGWTLAELQEFYRNLGTFLEAEKQPDWL